MKESKLIEMQNRISKIGEVLNELIQKLQQVDQLANGTLTAFQLTTGKDQRTTLVQELKDVESRPQPEEKKFENVE